MRILSVAVRLCPASLCFSEVLSRHTFLYTVFAITLAIFLRVCSNDGGAVRYEPESSFQGLPTAITPHSQHPAVPYHQPSGMEVDFTDGPAMTPRHVGAQKDC